VRTLLFVGWDFFPIAHNDRRAERVNEVRVDDVKKLFNEALGLLRVSAGVFIDVTASCRCPKPISMKLLHAELVKDVFPLSVKANPLALATKITSENADRRSCVSPAVVQVGLEHQLDLS
jgi:hypothetical protein